MTVKQRRIFKSKSVGHQDDVIERLQRALPLAAHGKPELLAFLRTRKLTVNKSPRLKVLSIFQLGRRGDLVCRIVIDDGVGDQMFFAPLTVLIFDHGNPAALSAQAASRRGFA